jgi:predicted XRE-type DNA-binding protein
MRSKKMDEGRPVVARTAADLAGDLGLSPADAATIDLRVTMLRRITSEVRRQGLTHAEAAARCGTSRSRMTAILNGAIDGVSTDLLLRMLASLGVRARVSFTRAA